MKNKQIKITIAAFFAFIYAMLSQAQTGHCMYGTNNFESGNCATIMPTGATRIGGFGNDQPNIFNPSSGIYLEESTVNY